MSLPVAALLFIIYCYLFFYLCNMPFQSIVCLPCCTVFPFCCVAARRLVETCAKKKIQWEVSEFKSFTIGKPVTLNSATPHRASSSTRLCLTSTLDRLLSDLSTCAMTVINYTILPAGLNHHTHQSQLFASQVQQPSLQTFMTNLSAVATPWRRRGGPTLSKGMLASPSSAKQVCSVYSPVFSPLMDNYLGGITLLPL